MAGRTAARVELESAPRRNAFDVEAAVLDHGSALLAYARVLTMDASDAEDLVQTTFEIALRNGHQLRRAEAARAWLFKIETREALRLRRRIAHFVRWSSHHEPQIHEPDADHIAVRQALVALPVRTRAAVALHHMAGMTVADTAETMGISPNSVKTLLRIGLARMRERLEQ